MSSTASTSSKPSPEAAAMSSSPVRRWLRHPLTWAGVVVGALLGMIMTFAYIGGLVDPQGHLHDAPVGFVNADAGAAMPDPTGAGAGQSIDAGDQVKKKLTATETDKFDWQEFDSKDKAEAKLRDNELWGAIVVPKSFSADLLGVAEAAASGGSADAAKLEILTNDGSGMFQPSVFKELSAGAVTDASSEANKLLLAQLDQLGVEISPDIASVLGQPVVADTQAVVDLPEKAGRGIAPFYLAVMVTLTGFLAASVVSVSTDLLRGIETVEVFGRELSFKVGDAGSWRVWLVKFGLIVVTASLGALLAVWTAHGILGMHMDSPGKAIGVAVLGAVTIACISLVFVTWFGISGEVLGVLFTTIFGVPSALGIYPDQAVPGVFGWIGSWHPLRYIADGMRSTALYGGSGAGLGKALVVIAIWLVAAILIGAGSALLLNKVHKPAPSPAS